MRRFLRPLACLAVLTGSALPPVKTASAATLMGTGITVSCGGWIEVRKGTPVKPQLEDWALGYLSGVAMWTPESPLDNLDPGAVFVWLDNYCQQRPLEPFKLALDNFVRARATPPAGQAGAQPGAQPSAQPAARPPASAGGGQPRPR